MALACDMRIAGRYARFGTAYARVGFSGDFGGAWALTRLIGSAKTRELFLTADVIDSAQAQTLGVVNEVVDDDKLHASALEVAARFANGPTVAYSYMKRNFIAIAAETQSLAEALELEAMHQISASVTEDHKDAAAAFLEKRKPNFKGR